MDFDNDIPAGIIGVHVDQLSAGFQVSKAADSPRLASGFAESGEKKCN